MESDISIRVLAIIFLVGCSAFFSASEAAFFSLGRFPLQQMEEQKNSRARLLQRLLEYPRKLIITILIGNESINILLSIMVAGVFASLFLDRDDYRHLLPEGEPTEWVSLISIVATALLLFVFGETLPKTVGVRFARVFTSFATIPLYIFYQAIYPLRFVLRRLTDRFLGLFGINPDEDFGGITDEELLSLLKIGKEEGVLDHTEQTLLHNIFDFGDIQVYDVMTPSHDIFRLPVSTPVDEIIDRARDRGYSRIPIYRGEQDNIIGVLNAKDLIRLENHPTARIEDFLHKPYFIPRQKLIDELLVDFQSLRTHLALVVNEFGAIIGLVTMEDILEEIFGEAASERPEEDDLIEIGEGRWEALGRIELNAFREKLHQKLSAPGVRTLGGYLLHHFGRMPSGGEDISREGFRFTVKEIRRMRIHRVLIEKEPDG